MRHKVCLLSDIAWAILRNVLYRSVIRSLLGQDRRMDVPIKITSVKHINEDSFVVHLSDESFIVITAEDLLGKFTDRFSQDDFGQDSKGN